MRGRRKQLNTALAIARLATVVVSFLFAHDAMMALSPHEMDADSHSELMVEGENCGSAEGVSRSSAGPSFEPSLATTTPIFDPYSCDSSTTISLQQRSFGTDSSAIRIWQQVYLN